ncbi:MAG: restriction endonuclease [Syntrophales bacterium]|nr:restriction endonuclease [Syntrophales bacterium]MDD5640572.1 restriction endonuclease [Syntrophales bacterium]
MGRTIYTTEVWHSGLNKHRIFRGSDKYVVERKANLQLKAWDEMWERKKATEMARYNAQQAKKDKEIKKSIAAEQTNEAQTIINDIQNILNFSLEKDHKITDWNKIKDNSKFIEPTPILELFEEPKESEYRYQPKLNFLDWLFPSRKDKKLKDAHDFFIEDHNKWKIKKEEVERQYNLDLSKWEKGREDFYNNQKRANDSLDVIRKGLNDNDPEAILKYIDLIFSRSQYPDFCPKEYEIDYFPDTKILLIEYLLPSIDDTPRLKEVIYIQSNDIFKEKYLSDTVFNKMYDDMLYKLTLRCIFEIFQSDLINAIDSVIFNGLVEGVDKSTGIETTNCLLSIHVNKNEFMAIKLENVEPKKCFIKFKGIGSSKLHDMTPIAPIMKISRDDARFISAYDVASSLDESVNIAAMDWQDFEHLIREIFEKEFQQNGGEVKITRASRDAGVDAIAFDPDPIRGGKIVVQAKRYVNTVGVAAVRDLYGTVINEGATKGILVTTSNYGSDAHEFARGKPITLLNGNHLLHLLEKHGYKAKIDLKEAKRILSDQEIN